MKPNYLLGIDVGSGSLSIVLVDSQKKIIQSSYEFHEGQIIKKLESNLQKFKGKEIDAIAVTSSTPDIFKYANRYDNRVCFITASKKYFPNADALLLVGGEKFGLALFDESGNYKNYISNSSCAAGTGSFLDQQSRRLNLKSIQEFSELAFRNDGDFPQIASRCAVFAKTDLIHAQQEGFSLAEICDGLCHGLSKNIVDTVFSNAKNVHQLVFAGGVSQNKAVVKHIEKLTGFKTTTHPNGHLFGAYGAVLCLIKQQGKKDSIKTIKNLGDLIQKKTKEKTYYYEPLALKLSTYPDFNSWKSYNYIPTFKKGLATIEVDLYANFKELQNTDLYLGIDIGSTSTKAVLLNKKKQVLAGLYTRTAGQPVIAIQSLFECIDQLQNEYKYRFTFLGTGTTGSGRKFIGRIIGADLILDEITAHAKAAVELDPEVDTIIEIGGQDSKFTMLSNGQVTFSIMNNVCAAGTGSFIEEQAQKLGVPLLEYSARAEKRPSPMASDRCTVFMERDLNHYMNENYEIDEILASVLHSVRENYLSKVASSASIGKKIFFQGATAKNRALIAAFEQKLKKPIIVSKYCHLTGAMGVALELCESEMHTNQFRGIELYQKQIPVHAEVCELCTNHCKLNVARINGTTEAYGFLCGRDYQTDHFIENNTSGFDLIKSYKETFRFNRQNEPEKSLVVGIPAALYLWENLFLWKTFFDQLKIKTISTEKITHAVKTGKNISGAEFCAPVSAFYGHVKELENKCDYIFLPVYLEEKEKNKKRRRFYCYYSQYAASLAGTIPDLKTPLISPLLNSAQNKLLLRMSLFKSLHKIIPELSIIDISNAYDYAKKAFQERKKEWKNLFTAQLQDKTGIKVALLGRPYTILSQAMNNKIPGIFSRLGIKTFYQDMLPIPEKEGKELKSLLKAFKWNYAAKIMVAADYIARTKNIYPVLLSSFKCTPDAFVIEYFKHLLDAHKKPYLVLQLDEHDSSVGYETRIEAALRSFRNHANKSNGIIHFPEYYSMKNMISGAKSLKGKTLLMPNWDDYAVRLLVATLRNAGIDARYLKDTNSSIQKSLVSNTGQCIPLNIILQDAVESIRENKLEPANTAIWMINSNLSCNLSMFPHFMKKLLNSMGGDLEDVNIYLGDLSFVEISMVTSLNVYLAYMFGGYLRKIVHKIRPYEVYEGETDKIATQSLDLLCETIEKGKSKEKALKQVLDWFMAIKTKKESRPKVAIFGDLYVRDNEVFNQDLVRLIEKNGGEAITTPYSEYLKIISSPYLIRLFSEGKYLNAATMKFLRNVIPFIENKYYPYFKQLIDEPPVKFVKDIEQKLGKFNVKVNHSGESMENLLKIFHIVEQHPDLRLFVQTNPAYCCPSLVTEAMAAKIEQLTGVPVVSIEYDGTMSKKNEDIIPFLKLSKTTVYVNPNQT